MVSKNSWQGVTLAREPKVYLRPFYLKITCKHPVRGSLFLKKGSKTGFFIFHAMFLSHPWMCNFHILFFSTLTSVFFILFFAMHIFLVIHVGTRPKIFPLAVPGRFHSQSKTTFRALVPIQITTELSFFHWRAHDVWYRSVCRKKRFGSSDVREKKRDAPSFWTFWKR